MLLNINGEAQRNFRGEISFAMTSPDNSVSVKIHAFYWKNRIKFETHVEKVPGGVDLKNEIIILNFKDSTIDRIKPDEGFVEREKMMDPKTSRPVSRLVADPSKKLVILGEECTWYAAPSFSKEEVKNGKAIQTNATLGIWYAERLHFDIPDTLHFVDMVPLFSNDKIALGSEISIEVGDQKIELQTRAFRIKNGRVKNSVFRYPKGFDIRVKD